MAWTEGRIQAVHDNPLLGVAVAIGMALVAVAIYVGWGRAIERRDVTELATPGAGREFLVGGLIGAGPITGCAVLQMLFGMYRIEGLNPLSHMIPAVAMAVKSSLFFGGTHLGDRHAPARAAGVCPSALASTSRRRE